MLSEEEKKSVEDSNECEIYFTIDGIGGVIWRTNHDIYAHGRYEMTPELKLELEHLSEIQKYALQQLTKFGIDPESAKDKPNGDYWKWYTHWNNWKNEMSNEEWRNFERKKSKDEGYLDLLPKTKWNE